MAAPVQKTVEQEAMELIKRGSEVELHRARRLLQAELRRDDSDPHVHNLLATAHSLLGEHDEAIRVMKTAIRMAPNNAHLLNNLGTTYKAAGRYAEAGQTFQRLLDGLPDDPNDTQVALVKRMANLFKLISDIGAARQTDKSGAEIIEEMRR